MGPRKYHLDWLRVLAFLCLIFFHVGMLYVTWTYNIKSPRQVPAIEPAMNALGAFRLALLFFVSGVASRFLIAKLGPRGFARDRLRRLLPVILFGMFVVIPPQTYVELVSKGVTSQDYLTFWWSQYLAADQTLVRPLHKTMPTWDHLWFIVYLFFYTLIFALAFALTHWRTTAAPRRWKLPMPVLLLGPAILLAAVNLVIITRFPITDALVNDWGGHLKWLGMFAIGVACAHDDRFWDWTRRHRSRLALLAVALVTVQTLIHTYENLWYQIVYGLYAWAAICALVGYAGQYLNRPSALLTHLNEAVLPIYVLHQPILLIAAYFIFPLHLPLAAEAAALAAITGFGSFAIYEVLIRPFRIPRILFGLKPA
jgi:surface polysaccharide O-acyltransferase-like enzyme